jgi:catechol 2,3-dioxygenase
MKIRELGHVVLQVTDLDRSIRFYRDTLGLPLVSQGKPRGRRIVFFSLGAKHHDLALIELGPGAKAQDHQSAGVMHIAFKIGDDIELLKEAKARMTAAGVPIVNTTEHMTTYSLYLSDPDGITVELYVDRDPATWRDKPDALGAFAKPLAV